MRKELSRDETLFFLNRFHGHIGPYLVLGYRAGLIANRILGDDPFARRAHSMTGFKPPISCFTDGIQLGSCCTLGKGNITVSDEGEPRVRFELRDGSRSLEISLSDDAKALIVTAHDWDEADRLGCRMLDDPEEELFMLTHHTPSG